MDEDIYLEMPR